MPKTVNVATFPPAPKWAVPVRRSPFLLAICGVGPRTCWRLSRGALVSPLHQ